jgi:uncharacterized protein YjbI with pentapeptide repeats
MRRRGFLGGVATMAGGAFSYAESSMNKTNIKSFGKIYSHLQDPALRTKDIGDSMLVIDGAEFSGVNFADLIWRNLRFVNCDFIGAYEIKLERLEQSLFENCRFGGIHSFGDMVDVKFLRCQARGRTFIQGQSDSKNLVFEKCSFVGKSSEPNEWGSVGSYAQATFMACEAKWFNLRGHSKLDLVDCSIEDVNAVPWHEHGGSHVFIDKCKLRGTLDLSGGGSLLLSLTVQDTVLENLDLRDATVKGDVTMKRIKGGYINAYVRQAGGLRIRNSQILGNGRKIFEAYAGGIQSIEIDTVVFGGDLSSEPVTIAGGFSLKSADRISNISQSIDIRNSTIPTLDASYLHTQRLVLQDNQIMRANMSNSRVADLEISGTRITGKLDFHGTQATQQKVDLSVGSTFGRVDQMDGSNIRLQPRSTR